jgi:serine/threonine-protein kinase
MATQNAVPLLSEDWAAIEVFVQETASGQENFESLLVVDHDGMIRGSKDAAQIGTKYASQGGAPVASSDPHVSVNRVTRANGASVLDFTAPILFQGKTIGQVHLGLFEAPLTHVANLMLVLLAILTLVTTAAVALGAYLMARRLSGVVRVMKSSLEELGNGRYDYRIAETRNDEFGELYTAFDAAAAALEGRHDQPAAKAPEGMPAPTEHTTSA